MNPFVGKIRRCVMALCFAAGAVLVPAGSGKAAQKTGAPEDIIGIVVSYAGMRDAYSFELREENGTVLFSHNPDVHRGQSDVLENVPVDPEYMRRLREMAKRHGFARMREKDLSKRPFIRDAPMYGTTLYWPNDKRLRLNYWPARDELERFFWEITGSVINKPGPVEELSALSYDYVHTDNAEQFNFSLRADKTGQFLFSANYFTREREKVVLSRVPVDAARMRELREIVKKHDITAMQGESLPDKQMRRESFPPPYAELTLSWPDMCVIFLGQPASGGDELKRFFQNLAEANTEHWEQFHNPDLIEWLMFSCTRANEAESFRFHLREVSASTELMAICVTKEGKKLDFYATVDPQYMDQARAIVKKHGLVERLKKMPYAERERSVLKDKFPCVLTMDWRYNVPRLRLPEWPSPGGEELEAFFRNLAEKYALAPHKN